MDKHDILELFSLEDKDVLSCNYRNANGSAVIDIRLVPKYDPCPNCGSAHPKIKGYSRRVINHGILTDRLCLINYDARRYQCSACNRTYMEKSPFSFGSSSISPLTVQNVLRDLKNFNETFSSVAHRYHISPTSAASIFDQHVSIPRKPLPSIINFDEVYAFRHHSDKYVCVILDFQTSKPVDVLNSRRYDRLLSYFMQIPLEERKNVKACCFDMYDTYRSIMHSCFPNAIGCVDHYHLSQELGRKIDAIRIRIMKGTRKGSDEYYLLKKFNWILYKPLDASARNSKPLFDPNAPRKYNYHFKTDLNYYDIRNRLLSIDSELADAWRLKDDMDDFYQKASDDTAEDLLAGLIKKFLSSAIEEMRHFAKTLNKWKVEIINSVHVYGYAYRIDSSTGEVISRPVHLTNAIIENRNSIIKCLKKNANGYRNWERFRNRILYVLDKDALPLLNPLKQK